MKADHSRSPLARGWGLLGRGRSRDAALAFDRVLLQDPGHAEAREGRQRSLAATAEQERLARLRLDEARAALEAGDESRARSLLEALVDEASERERALELLDRLDERPGFIRPTLSVEPGPAGTRPLPSPRRRGWIRVAFAAFWAVTFAVLAGRLATGWEQLVRSLLHTPQPSSAPAPPSTYVPAMTSGEQAIARARRLVAEGNGAAALATLDRIPPEDPAYPFARQLRGQTEKALRERGLRR